MDDRLVRSCPRWKNFTNDTDHMRSVALDSRHLLSQCAANAESLFER